MKAQDRNDGGIEILYGSKPDTATEKNHGHYGEDGNGV
jgi:hypothetical protein